MDRYDILAEAKKAVKIRESFYGSPKQGFERTAKLWNVILKEKLLHEISASDVAMMMIALKLARLIEAPSHADSAVDVCGYAALLSEIS